MAYNSSLGRRQAFDLAVSRDANITNLTAANARFTDISATTGIFEDICAETIICTSNTIVHGDISVNGTGYFRDIIVQGDTTIRDDAFIVDDTTISGSLTVVDYLTVSGPITTSRLNTTDISATTISGSSIFGTVLTISGPITTSRLNATDISATTIRAGYIYSDSFGISGSVNIPSITATDLSVTTISGNNLYILGTTNIGIRTNPSGVIIGNSAQTYLDDNSPVSFRFGSTAAQDWFLSRATTNISPGFWPSLLGKGMSMKPTTGEIRLYTTGSNAFGSGIASASNYTDILTKYSLGSTSDIDVSYNDTINARIDNITGYVGIGRGVTSPQYELDLSGTTRINGGINTSSKIILGPSPSSSNLDYSSVIESVNVLSSNYGSDLRFSTHGTGSSLASTERMRITNTGNVGIGVTSPGEALDVNGAIKIRGQIGNSRGEIDGSGSLAPITRKEYIQFCSTDTSGTGGSDYARIYSDAAGATADNSGVLVLEIGDDLGGGHDSFVIRGTNAPSSGVASTFYDIATFTTDSAYNTKVGMGIRNPQYTVDVCGLLNIRNGYAQLPTLRFSSPNDARSARIRGNISDISNFGLEFCPSGTTPQVFVAPDGKLGAGLFPVYNLDVSGIFRFLSKNHQYIYSADEAYTNLFLDDISYNSRFRYTTNADANYLQSGNLSTGAFKRLLITRPGSGTDYFRFYDGGMDVSGILRVGTNSSTGTSILVGHNSATEGSTASTGLLLQSDNSKNGYVRTLGNGNLYLGSNNSNYMTLKTNGNVGVGNGDPQYKLDVSGDLNVTGNIYSGNAISSVLFRHTIDLRGVDTSSSYFYPVIVYGDGPFNFLLHKALYGDAEPYNNHFIYGETTGGGWSDFPKTKTVVYQDLYNPTERSIYGIYRGTQNFHGVCYYLRGGSNGLYYLTTNSNDISYNPSLTSFQTKESTNFSVFPVINSSGTSVSLPDSSATQIIFQTSSESLTPSGITHFTEQLTVGYRPNSSRGVYLTNGYGLPAIQGVTTTFGIDNFSINPAGGFVGLGSVTPTFTLDVSASGSGIRVNGGTNNTSRIILGPTPSLSNLAYSSVIESVNAGGSNYGSDLRFSTHRSTSSATSTERMRITNTGNVGVGTTTPSSILELGSKGFSHNTGDDIIITFSNTDIIKARIQAIDKYYNDPLTFMLYPAGELNFQIGKEDALTGGQTYIDVLTLSPDGYVGVRNTTPSCTLDVANSLAFSIVTGDRYFNINTSSGDAPLTTALGTVGVSIKGLNYIWATVGFVASSDRRIKTDISDLVDDECLSIIRKLKPKKYTYIDKIDRGAQPVYGFIAQDIHSDLSYATSIKKEIIPDYYDTVSLDSITSESVDIVLSKDYSISADTPIKLLIQKKDETILPLLSSSLEYDSSLGILKIKQNESISGLTFDDISNIFFYGKEVDDFHTLNKDAIWTVATAALQEVDRLQQQHHLDIERLKEAEAKQPKLFRGSLSLSGTSSSTSTNLDSYLGLTPGEFSLKSNPQVFLQNRTGWAQVRGSVVGDDLVVYTNTPDSTDMIDFMIVVE